MRKKFICKNIIENKKFKTVFSLFLIVGLLFSIGIAKKISPPHTTNKLTSINSPKYINQNPEILNDEMRKMEIDHLAKTYMEELGPDFKLEKKWAKALKKRGEKEEEIQNNYDKRANVLFSIRSKEKNFDMNFVNKKPITKEKTTFKSLISKQEQEKYKKETNEQIHKFYTAHRIPMCNSSFSETSSNPLSYKFKDDEVIDTLLFPKEIQKNIDRNKIINKDFFGNKNNLKFYSQDFLDIFSLSLKHADIKCLPLRVIVTKNLITKHYGTNALKNYDFNKEGELHYLVKKNLKKFLNIS